MFLRGSLLVLVLGLTYVTCSRYHAIEVGRVKRQFFGFGRSPAPEPAPENEAPAAGDENSSGLPVAPSSDADSSSPSSGLPVAPSSDSDSSSGLPVAPTMAGVDIQKNAPFEESESVFPAAKALTTLAAGTINQITSIAGSIIGMGMSAFNALTEATGLAPWTAAIYPFFQGLDLRTMCGSILDAVRQALLPRAWHTNIGKVPDSFDAREQWPHCKSISEIQDQGKCASCWAVSSAAVMSDRYCVFLNRTDIRISPTDLLTCCGANCATNGDGCQGGYPDEAFRFWTSKGIVQTSCKKYRSKMETCASNCDTDDLKYTQEKLVGDIQYRLAKNETQIQAEIKKFGSVVAGITVYQDFMSYKSGVYQHKTGEQIGGHAIRVIGWGEEGDVKYWLCANSFGPKWGEQGYVRILRGVNQIGIEGWVTAGTPDLGKSNLIDSVAGLL